MTITDYTISYLALSTTGGLLQLSSIWGFSSVNGLFEAVYLFTWSLWATTIWTKQLSGQEEISLRAIRIISQFITFTVLKMEVHEPSVVLSSFVDIHKPSWIILGMCSFIIKLLFLSTKQNQEVKASSVWFNNHLLEGDSRPVIFQFNLSPSNSLIILNITHSLSKRSTTSFHKANQKILKFPLREINILRFFSNLSKPHY